MSGVTLDAGALIALDRQDRKVLRLLQDATERAVALTIPGTVLAQAIRNPSRQSQLMRLVRQPNVAVAPLDRVDATAVGRLLAVSGTSDIADAHVVVCARRSRGAVLSSDAGDLRQLDSSLEIIDV